MQRPSRQVAGHAQLRRLALSGTSIKRKRHESVMRIVMLARDIYEEVLDPYREEVQRGIDKLRKKAGEEELAALLAKVEPQASSIVEQALRKGL